MSSLTRPGQGSRGRPAGWVGPLIALLAISSAACGQGGLSNSEVYSPPPALALVALVDPSSGRMAGELHQLQDVIRTTATPGEALVVMILQPSYGQTYVVRSGDSLSKIASGHNISLAALEAANPQLGPLSGRNWKLIHPNEQVMIPDGAAQGALLLVSRAPAGPPPPNLIRLPREPSNPTDFQRAQYNRTVASDNATKAAAAWTSAGTNAGAASVSALDPALTKLQLAQVVNHQAPGQ